MRSSAKMARSSGVEALEVLLAAGGVLELGAVWIPSGPADCAGSAV